MYFDALTLTAVADELRTTLLGGRIQRVLLPGPLSIGLEIYAQKQRYHLIASAHQQFARVHLVSKKLSRGVEQHTPMLLLLRKYVLAGRIVAVEQPPLERILLISIAKEAESRNYHEQPEAVSYDMQEQESGQDDVELLDELQPPLAAAARVSASMLRSELVIELMERRSNIILVDDNNLILESVKRVTPRMSRRVVLPRHVYEFPPGQSKRDPRTATAQGIEALRAETGESKLTRALVAGYRGVSPQVAREVVFRALGQPEADMAAHLPWYMIAARLRELFHAPPEPTLVSGDEGPIAYAPYVLTHIPGAQLQPSMSVALETFYREREAVTAHRRYRDAVRQQLDAARERLLHQRNQLTAELEWARTLEEMRWEGEMIFAFLHTLTPGQRVLEVDGRSITLDPDHSPVEAAQKRFRAYDKAKSALAGLPERLRETENRLAGLEQVAALLEVADAREQIEQIAREAEEQGYIHRPNAQPERQKGVNRPPRVRPLHLVSSDGFDIYVGRTSGQNAEVTFRIGRPEDLWLHVRTIPGAHVIIRTGGREVPEQTLREAAGLAAYYSRVRDEPLVDVDVSRRSLVRKVAGGPPGLVTYRAEQSLRVAPLPPWS